MSDSMRAMLLEAAGRPVKAARIPRPRAASDEIVVRVRCCAVCRTDLHVRDGELADPKLPLVLGHQVVGTVEEVGERVDGYVEGQRVGIPWLGRACGDCKFCRTGRENLCREATFTGYQRDGGYAEYAAVQAQFALPLPGSFPDIQAAPLLCAGLIGYRALSLAGDAERLGLYGFGSSAHIIAQVARYQGRRVFAFTRPGDRAGQAFSRSLGAEWAGGSDEPPPEPLDAAIIFAPAGALVPRALASTERGGSVICAGIHMSEIPAFPYELLWGERTLRSVANLTRKDGLEFLELAPRIPIQTRVTTYPLGELEKALDDLRHGRFEGSAVITISP